jgi:purine-binding chemotaxis protein CheW
MKKQSTETRTKPAERYLAFSLGREEYGVPLLSVKEVIAIPEITPVPFTPAHFLGITNLRGQIVSVIDLRRKFALENAERSDETALVILDLEQVLLGVVVDSVNEVVSLSESEVSDPPEMLDVRAGAFLTGVARKNEKLILLLDVAKTLEVDDLAAINRSSGSEAS